MKRAVGPTLSPCCNARVRRDCCTKCKRPAGASKLRRTDIKQPQLSALFVPSSASGPVRAIDRESSQQATQKMLDRAYDAPPPPRRGSSTGSWQATDDIWLWANRHLAVGTLAEHLGRGEGGITSRLVHLQDPSHAAYQRLRGVATPRLAPSLASESVPAAALNAQQRVALDCAQRGLSFFLTGGAGTGKSFTLAYIVRTLKRIHGTGAVFVTASTGIAACHVGGTTLHSFAGVGLGSETAAELTERAAKNRGASTRWAACRALVIDEVSMLDSVTARGARTVAVHAKRRTREPSRPVTACDGT